MVAMLALLLGCSSPKISGRVIDPTGGPVAGATITNTTGALCTTETGEDGHFELECVGSDLRLAVVKEGWFSEEVQAAGEGDRVVGVVRMVREPPGHGLFVIEPGGGYSGFSESGRLRREARGKSRQHVLVRDGYTANEVPAGRLLLMDDSAEPWRLWRVGEDDLVHEEHEIGGGRWQTDFGEQPKTTWEKVAGGRQIATVELEAGDWFLADWPRGQFNLNHKDQLYTGKWLVAK